MKIRELLTEDEIVYILANKAFASVLDTDYSEVSDKDLFWVFGALLTPQQRAEVPNTHFPSYVKEVLNDRWLHKMASANHSPTPGTPD